MRAWRDSPTGSIPVSPCDGQESTPLQSDEMRMPVSTGCVLLHFHSLAPVLAFQRVELARADINHTIRACERGAKCAVQSAHDPQEVRHETRQHVVSILCACFVPVAWGQNPTCGVHTPWAEFLRRNMMRWNPCERLLNVNNVGSVTLKWSHATGTFVSSSPAVANGIVYLASNGIAASKQAPAKSCGTVERSHRQYCGFLPNSSERRGNRRLVRQQ